MLFPLLSFVFSNFDCTKDTIKWEKEYMYYLKNIQTFQALLKYREYLNEKREEDL